MRILQSAAVAADGWSVSRINVKSQRATRKASCICIADYLHCRASETALQFGDYLPDMLTDQVLAYIRQDAQSRFLIAINFSSSSTILRSDAAHGSVMLSTALDRTGERVDGRMELRADEGILMRVNG